MDKMFFIRQQSQYQKNMIITGILTSEVRLFLESALTRHTGRIINQVLKL